jgi:hypothetical protein
LLYRHDLIQNGTQFTHQTAPQLWLTYLYILHCMRRTDNSVAGVAIELWTGWLRNYGSIPSKGKRLFSPPNIQTNSRICLGSYSVWTWGEGFISGGKAAGMWSWSLPSPSAKVKYECSSAYMPSICHYGMHGEFTCTACQAYLQQYLHGQHLEVNNIFVMYQCHVVWQKTATLQNFVKPETITYRLTQTAIEHRANNRSLDSPSVSKMDKCLLWQAYWMPFKW